MTLPHEPWVCICNYMGRYQQGTCTCTCHAAFLAELEEDES